MQPTTDNARVGGMVASVSGWDEERAVIPAESYVVFVTQATGSVCPDGGAV